MTIGASDSRDELVRRLRAMRFDDLDISFLNGKPKSGEERQGYDRFGKYSVRFGWGLGALVSLGFALLVFQAFLNRYGDYSDPGRVWIRSNLWWMAPIWAVPTYFLYKSNRRSEGKESEYLAQALDNNGLVALPNNTKFGGDLNATVNQIGTAFNAAFALKYQDTPQVAFGLSRHWWDSSSNGVTINRGLNPSYSLFVYVAIPELTNEFIYLNPTHPPVFDQLPAMNEKAKLALSKLASRYAVIIGGGQIGVGQAKGSMNGVDTSLNGTMGAPSGWRVCYHLLSNEVADIVEGLD